MCIRDRISALVASLAARDAALDVPPEPVTTQRAAKRIARKAAGVFDTMTQVIDVGLEVDPGIDPAPVAQRDLRADYMRSYAAALVAAERASQIAQIEARSRAAQHAAEIEEDDAAAIAALLEVL